MVSRALRQLPVVKGQEAEALNREVYPMLREILVALQAAMGADVSELGPKLDALIALLTPELGPKLDEIALLLTPITAAVVDQQSSTTTSAAFASRVCQEGFWLKNISTATPTAQKVYLYRGGTATAANGYELATGDERFFPCTDMAEWEHIADALGANTCWEAI